MAGVCALPLFAFEPIFPVVGGLPCADDQIDIRPVAAFHGFAGNIAFLARRQRSHLSEQIQHLPGFFLGHGSRDQDFNTHFRLLSYMGWGRRLLPDGLSSQIHQALPRAAAPVSDVNGAL